MIKPAKLLVLILTIIAPACAVELDYLNQYDYLDTSAVQTCAILNGEIQFEDANNRDKGAYCDYRAKVWTGDEKQALEFCKSNTPFHIRFAEPLDDGGVKKTHCQFRINLRCGPNAYQILNYCYQRISGKYTYSEAQSRCEAVSPGLDSTLAVFYSDLLSVYLENMHIGAAWVKVSDMSYYYNLGEKDLGNSTGIFVLDAAWKYHVKPGTILMMDEAERFEALCQYTPPNTMAEMFTMARIYSPVYPFIITDYEVVMPSVGYETIDAERTTTVRGKLREKFNTNSMSASCNRMSHILGVESYPIGIREQVDSIKPQLEQNKNHRYYLSYAWKNDGCSLGDYRHGHSHGNGAEVPVYTSYVPDPEKVYCNAFSLSFNSKGTFPSKAAQRAPIMCSFSNFKFDYKQCPDGWHTFKRTNGTPICHYVNTEHQGNVAVPYRTAIEKCREMGASLGGFESAEELDMIRVIAMKYGSRKVDNWKIEWHYYLGGVIPCEGNCERHYKASWLDQVSRNNAFLNEKGRYYWKDVGTDHVSYRADQHSFHTHEEFYLPGMYYICTRYPESMKTRIETTFVK